MKKYLISVLFSLCFSGLFATVSVADPLQLSLEKAMLQARSSIIDGDLQQFLSSIAPVNPQAIITQQQWQQFLENDLAKKLLLRGVPDLNKETVFLSITSQGDWAVYYAETNLSALNYQTLTAFLFHKDQEIWKPAGRSYGLTKAKPGGEAEQRGYATWSGQQEMLDLISSDDNFSIDSLISSITPEQ